MSREESACWAHNEKCCGGTDKGVGCLGIQQCAMKDLPGGLKAAWPKHKLGYSYPTR